jgi:hypothetical protein
MFISYIFPTTVYTCIYQLRGVHSQGRWRCPAMKRALSELGIDLLKTGRPLTVARTLGVAAEVALRESLVRPPLEGVPAVRFTRVQQVDDGGIVRDVGGEVLVELPAEAQHFVVRLALAVRLLLQHRLRLNLARVDVHRRDGLEGYHDLILDSAGAVAFVGELKLRMIALRHGLPHGRHEAQVMRGVLADHVPLSGEQIRFAGELLVLCTACRQVDYLRVRIAVRASGSWYNGHDWPTLPPATWLRGEEVLRPGEVPPLETLRALAAARCLPRRGPVAAVAPAEEAAVRPAGAAAAPVAPAPLAPALPFRVHVPPRRARPSRPPRTWSALLPLLTQFEARPGQTAVLLQDLCDQVGREGRHGLQTVCRWGRRVPELADRDSCWRLAGGSYSGVSGQAPWVLSLPCAHALFDCFLS